VSSRRAPSPPPQIPGYTFRKVIGTGGFSDVFLYEQQRPRRQVAIKVLLDEWSTQDQRSAFDHEADLMATLGNHPSIVTMYEAGRAPDGRPYLAMEYCSRPNLGARYRTERFSVAEAMRTTIQIAGAVETAHRLGILHRDIKPANILVTQFGHPVLTDFGISSTVDTQSAAEGMSIPWSPPESFLDPPVTGSATDVWALGATCFSLLAGRTPFEQRGRSNSSADLVHRIATTDLEATGRGDVPESLERVLRIAMAKNPSSRYPTVLAFARAVQQVQVELAHAMTPIDLLDEVGPAREEHDEGDGTRMNRVVAIDPDGVPARAGSGRGTASPAASPPPSAFAAPAPASRGAASAATSQDVAAHHGRLDAVPVVDPAPDHAGFAPVAFPVPGPSAAEPFAEETVHRQSATEADGPSAPAAQSPSRRGWIGIAVGAVGVVAVGGLVWWVVQGDDRDPATPEAEVSDVVPQEPIVGYVPPVRDLAAEADGENLVVSWEPPRESAEGDLYGWRVLSFTSESEYTPTPETTVPEVPRHDTQETCVEVVVIRGSSVSANAEQVCVAPEGA
jgi:serine/threonine protein kinase